MENVGQQLKFHLQMVQELTAQLSEDSKVQFGYFRVGPEKGYRYKKTEADGIVAQLSEAGLVLTETKRDTFSIDREFHLPDTDIRIKVSHAPEEADKLDILKEQAAKAQKELEDKLKEIQEREQEVV